MRLSPENNLRTWIEIDTDALRRNILAFRRIIGSKVKLMAVVKSNAYGHGLVDFAKKSLETGNVDWFGVDSFLEALKLRKSGIKKPILVLGYTLPVYFKEAQRQNISLTISNFESIRLLKKLKKQPKIHIKIDTGMHRQGFLIKDIGKVIKELEKSKIINEVEGVYTHFASAKDRTYPFYTQKQIKEFDFVCLKFQAHGFLPFIRHAAATGATLLYPETHYDMVRIGIGLYGFWPSRETMMQYSIEDENTKPRRIFLSPILSWKTIVSEIKKIPEGSFVGYDLTEKVLRPTKIAVLPVGYWHGLDRGLSSRGYVLIKNKRCKILGRVSMDMIVVDVTGIDLKVGQTATLLGKEGKEEITAYEWAEILDTSHYEIITRINPLIKRIYL
jgi:alanine racemase